MFQKILNENTVLKHISIKIDTYQVIQDEVISLEIKQDMDEFGIFGTLKLKDTFDINKLVSLNGDNKVTISLTDFFEQKSVRTYRIITTSIDPYNERFKLYEFGLIDEITFILSNAYVSKSFSTTPVDAFQQYLTYLKIDDLIALDKMKTFYGKMGTSQAFVVPQDISVLDFFTSKFREDNIRIWQDRYGLHVDEIILADMVPLKMINGKDVIYTNNTGNNKYLYKIHDYQEAKNITLVTNEELPVQEVYRYNTDKLILNNTVNLVDNINSLKLNTLDASKLQLTTGKRFSTQSIDNTNNQIYDLFDVYMKNNNLSIVVQGDILRSNINNIAKVDLKGNIGNTDSTTNGDVLSSGLYYIGGVSDRIIGDKLIQKLSLYRVDARKPR